MTAPNETPTPKKELLPVRDAIARDDKRCSEKTLARCARLETDLYEYAIKTERLERELAEAKEYGRKCLIELVTIGNAIIGTGYDDHSPKWLFKEVKTLVAERGELRAKLASETEENQRLRDAAITANAKLEKAEAACAEMRAAILAVPDLNLCNYNKEDVEELLTQLEEAWIVAKKTTIGQGWHSSEGMQQYHEELEKLADMSIGSTQYEPEWLPHCIGEIRGSIKTKDARIAELEQQLAEARKDSERLRGFVVYGGELLKSGYTGLFIEVGRGRFPIGLTLGEALDDNAKGDA